MQLKPFGGRIPSGFFFLNNTNTNTNRYRMQKQQWNSPESAPKDGDQILADVGLPWAVIAVWNSHDEKWVYASLQACDMANDTLDTYFENEQESTIKGWMNLPKLPDSKANSAWCGVDFDKFLDDLRSGNLDLKKL